MFIVVKIHDVEFDVVYNIKQEKGDRDTPGSDTVNIIDVTLNGYSSVEYLFDDNLEYIEKYIFENE